MKSKKSTTDIYLAAAMLALGAELSNTDKEDPRHMVFTFEVNTPDDAEGVSNSSKALDLDWVENHWTNGSLLVNATEYADAIRRMKSNVHTSR
jgi:hypothetical protein